MRERLTPASLADSLGGHIGPDVDEALKSVAHLLDRFELPGGVVLNLQAARKQLRLAASHVAAARVIAQCEAE